jgi:hypothetical protein
VLSQVLEVEYDVGRRRTKSCCSPPTRVADGTIETLGGLDDPRPLAGLLGEIYLAHATLTAATTCQDRLFRLQALEVRQSPSSAGGPTAASRRHSIGTMIAYVQHDAGPSTCTRAWRHGCRTTAAGHGPGDDALTCKGFFRRGR